MRSFESCIESLSRRMDVEDDPGRVDGMSAEFKRYIEDMELLKEFIDTDTVTNNGKIVGTQKEEVQPIGTQQCLLRTVNPGTGEECNSNPRQSRVQSWKIGGGCRPNIKT